MYSLLVISILLVVNSGHEPALIDKLPQASFSWSDKHDTCTNHPVFSNSGGWCAADDGSGQPTADNWLQVDLGDVYQIEEVATMGRGDHNQFVKKYNLFYSSIDDTFPDSFTDYGVFDGNVDNTNSVVNALNPDIIARYLRFVPTTADYNEWKSMRIEAYGTPHTSVCDVVDIDTVLRDCSSSWININGRIDNIVENAEHFWANDPSSAHVRRRDVFDIDTDDWFEENKNNIIILSFILNILTICVGSCICLRAGVCAEFMNGGKKIRYKKVRNYSQTDDEVIAMVHRNNKK